MGWLANTVDRRVDATRSLTDARTAMVVGLDYAAPVPPDPGPRFGRVASYAWGRDYHNVLVRRMRRIRRLVQEAWPGVRGEIGVDRDPIWERAWGERAGVGYAGKNTCLIAPGETSLFVLAVLLLTVEIPPDAPLGDHCGSCRRCLDACPTQAFVGPHQLDARRCVSYLTIEHDGPIPESLRPGLGSWLFGCDVCQEVCPHVRPRVRGSEPAFAPRHAWIDLHELLATPDEILVARFEGSPLRRAAPHRLKRNAAVVLGNRGDPEAAATLEMAARSPALREHAEWALARLGR
jgi:epoxyqueuosine reductase